MQLLGQHLGVGDHLRRVLLERRLQRFAERDRLGGDDVHERPALHAGEDGRVDLLGPLLLAQDEPAARAAQRLVASWW